MITSRAGEAGGRKFQSYKNKSSLSLSFLDSFPLLLPFHCFFFLRPSSFLPLLGRDLDREIEIDIRRKVDR